MNRRGLIKGMVAAAAVASPLAVQADEVTDWAAWWERSKKYTLQIAEAMPAADYAYVPFGSGTGDGVRAGDGARTFGQLMQHIGQAEGFYLGRFGKERPRSRHRTTHRRRRRWSTSRNCSTGRSPR